MGKTVTESEYFQRKYIDKFKFLIGEYDKIKSKAHPVFKKLNDFYIAQQIDRRVFLKYYHRYKRDNTQESLLPRKRGPKYKTKRPLPYIENKVVELRMSGNNKYEISTILKCCLKDFAPSPSGVYNILVRKGLNVLTPPIKKEKKRIIKMKAGELGHADCHYLSTLKFNKKRYYLVSLMDDCTRLTLCEMVEDIKSLTVMFSMLRLMNMFHDLFKIKFAEILTDNGAEFGSRGWKNRDNHPFERMLMELGVKHRYTMPYKPQTNGKIERFWRTLHEDMIEDAYYETTEVFKKELEEYLCYYNYERPHQGLKGQKPYDFSQTVDRIL